MYLPSDGSVCSRWFSSDWRWPAVRAAEKGAAPEPKTAADAANVQDERTALDKYVAAPDTNYSFRVVNTVRARTTPPLSWT